MSSESHLAFYFRSFIHIFLYQFMLLTDVILYLSSVAVKLTSLELAMRKQEGCLISSVCLDIEYQMFVSFILVWIIVAMGLFS